MKRTTKSPLPRFPISLGILSLVNAASATILLPSTTIFGSNNDGLAGFNTSTEDASQAWSNETNAVTMTQVGASGLNNSGLLDQANLVRSAGSSYTFTGVMTWEGGYADDNNRTGLMLFADDAGVVGDSEGLSLQWNIDTGRNEVAIRTGLNGPILTSATKNGISGVDVFGSTFTYEGTVSFVDATNLSIDFNLRDADNTSTSLSTTVLAADYSGEFFGFASRNRTRNESDPDQVLSFESFQVSVVPEPSGPLLLLGSLGFFAAFSRRRA